GVGVLLLFVVGIVAYSLMSDIPNPQVAEALKVAPGAGDKPNDANKGQPVVPDPAPRLPAEAPKLPENDRVVLDVPDGIADVEVGGGGKYLFLHQPQSRRIAMVDIAQAKIVHHFPANDDAIRFAAGATKLI